MAVTAEDIPANTPDVSVIVPTWNEEGQLAACLRSVVPRRGGLEVIVVDGGSTDRTAEIAASFGVRFLVSPVRQRASQLNFAVQEARGEILLFLHADTVLPRGWFDLLTVRLDENPAVLGGAFARRFDHASAWLKCTSALADWRGRLWGCFLGDQAMFIRSSVFWTLGGFHPMDRCEDLDLSLRLARHGRTCLLSPPVISSGRRFDRRGPVRQTWVDFWTAWKFIRHEHQRALPLPGRGVPVGPAGTVQGKSANASLGDSQLPQTL